MSMDGQGTKCRRNIAENYKHLSRMHERYRQQTDRRQADGRQHIATGRRQGVFSTLLQQSGMRAFHWWHSGNKKRTQNVSEYMLVLALYSLYAWLAACAQNQVIICSGLSYTNN